MNNIRTAITSIVLILLAAGYFASQISFFNGTTAEFAKSIDQPIIQWLALLVFIACIVFCFWFKDESRGEP